MEDEIFPATFYVQSVEACSYLSRIRLVKGRPQNPSSTQFN